MEASGELEPSGAARQQVRWTWQLVRDALRAPAAGPSRRPGAVPDLETAVLSGELTPTLAAEQILQTFLG